MNAPLPIQHEVGGTRVMIRSVVDVAPCIARAQASDAMDAVFAARIDDARARQREPRAEFRKLLATNPVTHLDRFIRESAPREAATEIVKQ